MWAPPSWPWLSIIASQRPHFFAFVWVISSAENTFVCLALLANPCFKMQFRGLLKPSAALYSFQVEHKAPSTCHIPAYSFPPAMAHKAQGPPPHQVGAESDSSRCRQGRPGPGPPAAVRDSSVDEWVSASVMGLAARKSGFTHLLCHLLLRLALLLTLVTSFLICCIEIIIIATSLGYWQNQIKHLEGKSFVNCKILFDSNPLESFLGIHTHMRTEASTHTHTGVHIRTHVGILPSTYGCWH